MTRTVAPIRFRVGTLNAPERTDRTKRSLFAPARRAIRLKRWANSEGVGLLGVQESGSVLARAIARGPRWWASYAPANTVIKGHRIGNGVIGRRREWKVIGRDRVSVPMVRRRPLSFPVRIVRHRASGIEVAFIVAHKPRNQREYVEARRVADSDLKGRVAELLADDMPVVVVGDWNGAAPDIRGLRTVARHKADAILTSDHFTAQHEQSHDLPGISDHAALTVDLALDPLTSHARPVKE